MLSIRFGSGHEWWVSGQVFDRLFDAALGGGWLSSRLEHWRHVANANGGFDVSAMDSRDAAEFIAALRTTAQSELAGLGDAGSTNAVDDYRVGLTKLLGLRLGD